MRVYHGIVTVLFICISHFFLVLDQDDETLVRLAIACTPKCFHCIYNISRDGLEICTAP